jgi:hypothetical protein
MSGMHVTIGPGGHAPIVRRVALPVRDQVPRRLGLDCVSLSEIGMHLSRVSR